jgi:hypothetical protein
MWLMNYIATRQLIFDEAEQCRELALKALRKMLELEKTPLFTQNLQLFHSERTEWLRRYEYGYRWPTNTASYPTYSGGADTSSVKDAMVVMADVRAFFEVAYRVCSSCR